MRHHSLARGVVITLVLCTMLLPTTVLAQDKDKSTIRPFEVMLHVASADPEETNAWFDKQLALANQHFAPAGVAFQVAERKILPASFNTVDNIRERIALQRHFVNHYINIFVVDEILDPWPSKSTKKAAKRAGIQPSKKLAGAHIRVRGKKKRIPGTYVLVCPCGELVLTHELGHFFWLPHHRKDNSNIMGYGTTQGTFTDKQLKNIRAWGRIYRARRSVRSRR